MVVCNKKQTKKLVITKTATNASLKTQRTEDDDIVYHDSNIAISNLASPVILNEYIIVDDTTEIRMITMK